jgi:hypothetical protein
VAPIIDAVPRNHMHVDYRLEGEVLRRLRNVKHCTSGEFLRTIADHVDKRCKLRQ